MRYIHTTEHFYVPIKRDEALTHAMTPMNPESMLSESSHKGHVAHDSRRGRSTETGSGVVGS